MRVNDRLICPPSWPGAGRHRQLRKLSIPGEAANWNKDVYYMEFFLRVRVATILLSLACVSASHLAAAQKIALLTDRNLGLAASHGVEVLRKAVQAKGFEIIDNPKSADYQIIIGGSGAETAARALRGSSLVMPKAPETLTAWRGRIEGKPTVVLAGGDSRGLMYAAIDTAEKISAATGSDPFQSVSDVSERPYIAERGVSMYTMQRAYFEQRLYDERYWTRYFDMLAADRINSFVVIFGYEDGGFMAPLYPYFFNTTGFPGVEMVGVTAEEQARNVAAFKAMIRIAHERGIDVTAGIWDHIYRGGVQAGGIPGASEKAGKRVPGLVFGVTTENLAAYTKAALHRFVEVFPEVDAIQFRMHDESGLRHEEMQSFWHDVFSAIKRDHPDLRLDLRAKELPDAVINDALDLGLKARVSTKYWMEQMGLPFHPTHINTQNQKDRRHGYADLLRYPQRYRIHWQLWNGGTTRLLLWGDPEYVRRFASTVRLYDGNSFEVNEMLATKMLGEPQDEAPLEILNPKYRYYDYEFERYWHFYRVWGRVSYDPGTEPDVWAREFGNRFGPSTGEHLMKGLHLASNVLPRIVASSYLYQNFPTTRGWAEMNRQGSLPQYASEDGSDIQQFMNVRDEAKSILAGTQTAMRRPEETSRWFATTADAILSEVAQAEKGAGKRSSEFLSTTADLKILAGLARYHSFRLLAGVSYNLYKQSGDVGAFDDAIASERHAMEAWKQMVDAAGDIYSKNLALGVHAVGFSRHWEEEYVLLSHDFEKLLAERTALSGKTGSSHPVPRSTIAPPPVARITSGKMARPGRDFPVSVRVSAPSGVGSVRLRYRHVNQTEDYLSADMTLDPKTGNYVGRIPGSFIDTAWDVMYFVETIGSNGGGKMYPDLDVETPYVVVAVER
jgi:fructose-specific component phosphotransferase system IIB-like protein